MSLPDKFIVFLGRTFSPKLIVQICYKCLFQEEQAAKLRVGSCLQFKRHLKQVQGSLLERGGLR
jgi:hypothetical protein